MHRSHVLIAVLAARCSSPPRAMAGNYPPPKDPGKGPGKARGKGRTLSVCKQGCKYRTIQKADQRRAGATRSASRRAPTRRA